jgi:hypothetical protein
MMIARRILSILSKPQTNESQKIDQTQTVGFSDGVAILTLIARADWDVIHIAKIAMSTLFMPW